MLCKRVPSHWPHGWALPACAVLLLVLTAPPSFGQTCPYHELAVQRQLYSQQLQLQAAAQYQAQQQAMLHCGLYQQLKTQALASQHAHQQAQLNSAICQHVHRQSTAQLQAQQQAAIHNALYQQIKAHALINHQSQIHAGIGATAQLLKAQAASAGLHAHVQAGNCSPALQAQHQAATALASQQSGACLASAQLKQQELTSNTPSNPCHGSGTAARYLAFQQSQSSPQQPSTCSNCATLQQQELTSSLPYRHHHHHHHFNPYSQVAFNALPCQQSQLQAGTGASSQLSPQSSTSGCVPCQQAQLGTGGSAQLQAASGSTACSQVRISGCAGAQSGMALAVAATSCSGVFSGQGTFGAYAFSISSGMVTESCVTLRGMMQFQTELALIASSPLEIIADRQSGAIIITWMTPTGGTVRQLATGTLGF
jgi:hypothetical protein